MTVDANRSGVWTALVVWNRNPLPFRELDGGQSMKTGLGQGLYRKAKSEDWA